MSSETSYAHRAKLFIITGIIVKLGFSIYFAATGSDSFGQNILGFILISWFEFGPFVLFFLLLKKYPHVARTISIIVATVVVVSILLYYLNLVRRHDPSRVLLFPFVSLIQYFGFVVNWLYCLAVKKP